MIDTENYGIVSLFPTPVYCAKMNRSLTESERRRIMSEHLTVNIGNSIGDSRKILDAPELSKLKEFILQHLNNCLRETWVPKNEVEVYITQSWANFTDAGQYHHQHRHHNSFLSGVFYIETNEKDSISFYKDTYEQIFPEVKEFNSFNSTSWSVPVEAGQIVIFPSSLYHGVEVLPKGSKRRISVAFNTFIKGEIGNSRESRGLTL